MRIAVVGTGYVAEQYAPTLLSAGAELVCHDVDAGRRRAFAARWGAREVAGLADLAELDLAAAVNLTPPLEHAPVTAELLARGVPVYSEKPLADTLARGRELAELAERTGTPLACAPDTILGRSQQQLRALVDAGAVGRPLWIHGAHSHRGHETWHPRPGFFFRRGAGPIFDIGPYWISAMVHTIGAVDAVTASGYAPPLPRTVPGDDGEAVALPVEVATSCALLLEFSSGLRASLLLSFDLFATEAPALEIVGDEGAVLIREPLYRGQGAVLRRGRDDAEWSDAPPAGVTARPWQRGVGVLEFVAATAEGRPNRLGAGFALHVLGVMEAGATSMRSGGRTRVDAGLPAGRPAWMP